MKIARVIAIVFVLTVIGALVLLPKTIDVKVEKDLDVNVDVAYTLIWNMQNWVGWSPWDKMDSTRLHSYIQGNANTRIGGEDQFTTLMPEYSNGKHVIVDAKINEYIVMDVYLDKVSMDEPVYTYRFDFQPSSEVGGKGTKVTWSMTDTANFLAIQDRMRIPELNENFSKVFNEGLENLVSFAKEQEIYLQFQRFDFQPNNMVNALVGEVTTTTERDSIEYYYSRIGKSVFEFLQKNNIRLMEPPLLIYPNWDVKNNIATVQFGFSITANQKASLIDKLPKEFKIVDVGSPMLATNDVLPHDHEIEFYYDLMEKYMAIKKFDIVGPRMERYMSNPEIPGMPRHVVIMYPIIQSGK